MARSKTDLDPAVVAEHKLPSARLTEALGLLQDAHAKIQRAAEQLQIVDSTMIGSDEHRRLIVASSAENPIGVADDIRSHQAQAVEISEYAAGVRKAAQAVKGKGAFLAQALGSVYRDEIQAGDLEREKKKPQQDMFPNGTDGTQYPDGMGQCPECGQLVKKDELIPAPDLYSQEVSGNDAEFVLCNSCRSERNDGI